MTLGFEPSTWKPCALDVRELAARSRFDGDSVKGAVVAN